MSVNSVLEHPQHIWAPSWHVEAQTPIVDGKYCDPTTGEVREALGTRAYSGPPAVDIIIRNIHATTSGSSCRAPRSVAMETLLSHVVRVISERRLKLDSLVATPYAIRVLLAHPLTKDEFHTVAREMVNVFQLGGEIKEEGSDDIDGAKDD